MIPTDTTLAGEARRLRPAWTTVEVLGLVLLGAPLLLVTVISAVQGMTSGLGFFAAAGTVPLVAAGLAWRFGTWARVLGVVVTLLAGLSVFWLAFGLLAPDSVLDFVLGVTVPLGVVLGTGGGIAAVVAGRRGRLVEGATAAERRVSFGVSALLVVTIVASLVLTVAGRTSVTPGAAGGASTIEMANFTFQPGSVRVREGVSNLVVRNEDVFLHDLAVPALDVHVRVTPGSSAVIDLAGATPGTYTFYCTLHSDTRVADPEEAGMAGILIIE